jgi:glycerol-3-phosphate dehydrogenase
VIIHTESQSVELSANTREKNINRLQSEEFDILIIGGGITGAGVARDAALRGFKTALIEKADFASGTSSKSSKLIHGGFRYLESFEFGLVREALVERKTLIDIAPHLVHPIECLLPFYNHTSMSPWMVHAGLFLYDLLSFTKRIGYHKMLSLEDIHEIEPALRVSGLKKIARYYDCQADDFRLTMANVQSAAQDNAVVVNYVKAIDVLEENGQVVGIKALDEIGGNSFPLRSRVIANATGPWCDYLRKELLQDSNSHVRTTKGIHLVIHHKDLPINHTILGQAVQDGRFIFAVLWKQFVFLGTTDTDYDDPDNISIERSDVDYLLEAFNHYFPNANLNYDEVISTFAGLRPLTYEEGKTASSVTREYQIFEQPQNFFNIIGGKLTTYRAMAKEMIDRMARRLEKSFHISPPNGKCRTDQIQLYGGDISNYSEFSSTWKTQLMDRHHFDEEVAIHLIESYGSRLPDVLEYVEKAPKSKERFVPELPYIWAQVDYALQHEMTMALDDFLIRRTHLFSLDRRRALDVYEEIALRLAAKLGWSEEEKQAQIERYKSKIEITRQFLTENTGKTNKGHPSIGSG